MAEEKLTAFENITVQNLTVYSDYLEREVLVDVYIPNSLADNGNTSLLIFNDGQDLVRMPFDEMLDNMYAGSLLEPLICIGLHCGAERRMEYATAYTADYKSRGAKAGLYNKFVFDELMPFIRKQLNIPNFKEKAFAGFSLGGLSAMDIVWNNASEFSKVGVFSGSFWWRRKGYDDNYSDETDRIMHLQIRKGTIKPWLKFYFECGALDEKKDRNNNGVIDSIDDTLDIIIELKAKGYTDEHIKYVELPDGKHDVPTWAKALPDFLTWGWGKSK